MGPLGVDVPDQHLSTAGSIAGTFAAGKLTCRGTGPDVLRVQRAAGHAAFID